MQGKLLFLVIFEILHFGTLWVTAENATWRVIKELETLFTPTEAILLNIKHVDIFVNDI